MSMFSTKGTSSEERTIISAPQALEYIFAECKKKGLGKRLTTKALAEDAVCWKFAIYGDDSDVHADPLNYYQASMIDPELSLSKASKGGKDKRKREDDESEEKEEKMGDDTNSGGPPQSDSLKAGPSVNNLLSNNNTAGALDEAIRLGKVASKRLKKTASAGRRGTYTIKMTTDASAKAYHRKMIEFVLRENGFTLGGKDLLMRVYADRMVSRPRHFELVYKQDVTITKGDKEPLYATWGETVKWDNDMVIDTPVQESKLPASHNALLIKLAQSGVWV